MSKDPKIEEWRNVKGFNGFYQVSSMGRICSWKNNHGTRIDKRRILNPSANKTGYKYVHLSHEGETHMLRLHRLIAEAFIPNPDNKPQVNHINGIKTDNRIENLEWCTSKENISHAFENDLMNTSKGEDHYRSTLTKEEIKEIRSIADSRGYFYGSKELSERFNVAVSTIKGIVQRNKWKHV